MTLYYLYGSKAGVLTYYNPLTGVFATVKLNATGNKWVATLSDSTSRLNTGERTRTLKLMAYPVPERFTVDQDKVIFPEVSVCCFAS